MTNYVIFGAAFFLSMAGFADGARYYQLHPKELQERILACPAKQPRDIRCDELKVVALRVNSLAYELRWDPLAFGKKILSLQEEIARQAEALKTNPSAVVQTAYDSNKESLDDRLAVVRWLESPEG